MKFVQALWYVIGRLTRRKLEPFSAEAYARAVIAQNPKVWERLAEV